MKEKRAPSVLAQVEELTTSPQVVNVTKELAAVKVLLGRMLTKIDEAQSSDDPKRREAGAAAVPVFVEMAKTSVNMTRTAVDLAKELRALITVEQAVKLVCDTVHRIRIEATRDPSLLTAAREEELLVTVLRKLVWPDVQDVGRQVAGKTLATLAPALPAPQRGALQELRDGGSGKPEDLTGHSQDAPEAGRAVPPGQAEDRRVVAARQVLEAGGDG